MKHNCEIVRDLLPLYAEQIASPASTALVEEHLAECPACRAELQRMEKPVTVQPEPQADAPLKTIQIALTRRRVHTILVTLLVVLAVVLGVFARYAYTAYDKVGFFEARLQASYETADNGDKGWVLEVRGENVYLMQTQADLIDAPVQRPRCVETTAMGAAYLAGLAVGYWSSKEDVIKNWAIDRTFEPEIAAEDRAARIKDWNKAVKCAYGWAKDE